MKLPAVRWYRLPQLWWGKARRRLLADVFKGYTRRRHAMRTGGCTRCGACCQLGRVCPHLEFDENGLSLCKIYDKKRDATCRLFPTTESDLADRDLIKPGTTCGYRFERREKE